MLSEPTAPLSSVVQALWAVSSEQEKAVSKRLYADAGSGILFNLCGPFTIGEQTFPEGVIMLPVNQSSELITMAPGSYSAGIRFHPAIGYGILGRHYDQPTLLNPQDDQPLGLYHLFNELRGIRELPDLITTLNQWASNHLDVTRAIPDDLDTALDVIGNGLNPGQVGELTELSQRQLERYFKLWLGMTPKYYQRVLRIKKTIHHLRQNPRANLVDVAHDFGFSDQAHMTREFRAIAHTTPGRV